MAEKKGGFALVKQTFSEFSDDDCPQMAAALAYYTVFSLAPLLVLILMILGAFLDPQRVEQAITRQVGGAIGPEGARQIATMIESAQGVGGGGTLAIVLGIAGLLFAATGAFAQLQKALNRAWEVEPDPEHSGIVTMLLKRVLSLGMILVVAFLLLVSLLLSAALSAIGDWLAGIVPALGSKPVLMVLNTAVSLVVITLLFAAMLKVLPDARVTWSHVMAGAFVTALLFVAGKFALGLYLGRSEPGSAFGAAGALALILVWVYYSAMIFFLGAEFTQVWARRQGDRIEPAKGAVRIVEEKRHVGAGDREEPRG